MTIKNYDEKKSLRHPGEKTTKALEEEETLNREVIQKGSSLETDHNRLHLGAKGKSTIIR